MSLHKSISVIILSLSLFSFSNCGNAKANGDSITFQQNPPFVISDVTAQKWIAGTQEGGSGLKLDVPVSNVKEGVDFKDLYFRNQVVAAKSNPHTRVKYVGNFSNEKKDFVMDSDPINEIQNKPRVVFPFDIKSNEAIFSYEYQGKLSYYKIANIEELEPLALPSQNPNGID